MKVSYDAILKGIQFVIDHKDDITAAVKEGKDLIDWLREKFGSHEGLTTVERALLLNAIDDLANLNESQAPPLTPPPSPDPPAPTADVDPTSIEYDTLDEAKSHMTPFYDIVVEKPNGKFIVYPGTFPYVGTKVWPVD